MTTILTATRAPTERVIALFGLVIIADLLIWGVAPGLGFVALILCIALGAQLFWGRFNWQAWLGLGICLIPAIETFQFLSFIFAMLGLAGFCAVQICGGTAPRGAVIAAALRLPFWGNVQTGRDVASALRGGVDLRHSAATGLAGLRDWIVPGVLGAVFILLFGLANPVIDGWLLAMWPERWPAMPDPTRVIFWVLIALFVWPMLRLRAVSARLLAPLRLPQNLPRGILSAGSVLRSLVTFNAIFAVQTVLDVAYLSGGISLPDGIGYAEYAHRGAYPLLVTALLAGGFALLAQPWLAGRPVLRWLLLIWVAQNVVLVISSILRLDLYVDVYGLTRLRFAAFVWMVLVALGLALMIWQVLAERPVLWLFAQSAALAWIALFAVSLTNVDGRIAQHNLTHSSGSFDPWYVCNLSAGALPAIRAWEAENGRRLCHSREPYLRQSDDWREWGYRNARLRHKLNEMKGVTG